MVTGRKIRTAGLVAILFAATLCTACPQPVPIKQPQGGNEVNPQVETKPLSRTPGMYLVYTVNDPREGQLVERKANVLIADPKGGRREILFDYRGFIFHLVPSPDGRHIAFVGNLAGPGRQELRDLFIYDLDTEEYRDVSESGHFSRAVKNAPLFSPDGSKVFFLSQWEVAAGEFNVFRTDVESGRTGGLYTEPVEDVPLTMTQDGKQCVAVRRVQNVVGGFEYITIDTETGVASVLQSFNNITKVGPVFFDPEPVEGSGKIIYFDMKPIDPQSIVSGGIRSRQVMSIDLETGLKRILFDPTKVTYVYQVFPDSNGDLRFLLRRQEEISEEETPMSRIATARVDGSEFQYLTGTDARCYLLPPPTNIPPVSPDYSLLFYYRQDPVFHNEDIWVMKPDGTESVNISNTAGYPEGSAGWIVIPQTVE